MGYLYVHATPCQHHAHDEYRRNLCFTHINLLPLLTIISHF
jgi:hypothetical protein